MIEAIIKETGETIYIDYSIPNNRMLSAVKVNGEYIQINSNDIEFIDQSDINIEWEQRRYELSRAAMQGIVSNSEFLREHEKEDIHYLALKCADKMINILRGE